MKILHLMLACFYIDNYSYQENLLPKYHKKAGNEVEIVASLFTFDENGKGKWLDGPSKYENEHGIPVTRLSFKKGKFSKTLRKYEGLYSELERVSPDVIFIHGVQFSDISVVVKYLKAHKNVRVYADNHADFSNSAKSFVSKNIQHKILWRHYAQKIEPFVTKFYGVLPARVDFLKNIYGLPEKKIELLVMGADDEAVEAASKPEIRAEIRKKYGIAEDEIVLMTGGKIDSNKPQTLKLMETVNSLEDSNIKLLVFGSVVPELKKQFERLLSEKVKYIGWKKSNDIYYEFAAADILLFPGLHSVLWEQAVAMGKPCVFRKINGFSHVDLAGNCLYFEEESVESYCKVIQKAIDEKESLERVAKQKGIEYFSYKKIAGKAVEE